MKKLLTILASAATLIAFGDVAPIHYATFEAVGYTAGEAFSTATNDAGGADAPLYWYTEDADASNVISNYPSLGTTGPITSRPDYVKNGVNDKFLQIETSGRLYRAVNSSNGSNDFLTNGLSIATTPIYLDTLVKFTAADSAFGDDALENGDKIAISYVEHEAEDDEPYTNFVVRAGYVTGTTTLVPTNYFVDVPNGFNKDEWHRLTVRTISNVGDGSVGFVIYLDETLLTYSNTVAAGESVYVDAINADVQGKFYNSEIHALFPSAVRTGAEKATIAAASFSGNGSLDDVVFTTVKPEFIQEASVVTVNWDTNAVTSVTLYGKTTTNVVDAAEVESCDIEPDNDGKVTFAVEFVEGYVRGECTVTGGAGGWNGSNAFTNLAAGVNCNIVSMQPLYSVGDKYFEDVEAAIAEAEATGTSASSPATLKLLANCAEMIKFTSGNVILDLAGHDIQGTSAQEYSLVCQGAHLVVTNSVPATGAVKRPVESEDTRGAMYIKDDSSVVAAYDVKFDDIITVKPNDLAATDLFAIYSGTFFDEEAGNDPDEFAYNKYIQGGAQVTSLGGNYFQVGGAAPTTYALTVTVADHTSVTYKIGDGEATAYNEAVQVEAGSAVVITAAPASGYTYTDVVLGDGWSLDGESGNVTYTIAAMGEATTVVVPNPEAVVIIGTYEVVVTPTANADYSAIYTNDNTVVTFVDNIVTVTVHYAIMITATPKENYEYATTPDGWTAGQDGVITKVVDAAGTVAIPAPTAKSSYPTYITGHDDYKSKYDTWAGTYGADTGSAYEAAFLLNIAPNAADKTLKPTAITVSGSTVTITANQDLTSVNGKVYIKTAGTLAGLADAQWAEATLNETTGAIEMTSNGTAAFFKIKVDF